VGTAPSKHSSILNVKITFPKTEDPKEAVQSSICKMSYGRFRSMTGPQNPTNVNREKGHDCSQNDQRQMGVATLKGGRNKQSLATRTTMQTTQVKDESIL
jgi:hypothetical protein